MESGCAFVELKEKSDDFGNLSSLVKTEHQNYLVIVRKWMTDGL
jgi:hypothetical protein